MWLPLLRFNKSVCKSWRALIQTSFFVDPQTTTTTTSSSSSPSKVGSFILQTNGPSIDSYVNDIKMFMLSSSGDDDGDGDGEKKKTVFKMDEDLGFLPFYKDFQLEGSLRMVGSCNGIICLHDPYVRDQEVLGIRRQHYSHLRDVSLWNPATKQFRILPPSIPIEEAKDGGCELVAFGFDFKTNDYKVLRITTPWQQQQQQQQQQPDKGGGCMYSRVQVYSLSTDSWRLLEGIYYLPDLPTPQGFPFRNHGIYLNGSYLFVGTKPTNGIRDLMMMMLSFDFANEIFTTMQLPDNCSIYKLGLSFLADRLSTSLGLIHDCTSCTSCVLRCLCEKLSGKLNVFGLPRFYNRKSVLSSMGDDKMAVFTIPRIDSDGDYWYYDIWVLSEQHCSNDDNIVAYKEPWTKLHSFRIKTTKSKETYSEPGRMSYSEPRCISNNGEFALISTRTDGYSGEKLQLFNLVTKEVEKEFSIGEYKNCRGVYVYKESLVSVMGGGNNVLLRWQLPAHGTTYRLNWDAPFIDSHWTFGIGLCLTTDTGGCIGVRSLNRRHVRDAEVGEALVMLEAIKWAKKLELSPIIIESNSKNCVSFFMDEDYDDNNSTYWSSEALSLLGEAKVLIFNSPELGISFQYSSRSCNYVTDIAAKLGREGFWACKDWTANFPGEIVMSLSKDLGIETYGREGS